MPRAAAAGPRSEALAAHALHIPRFFRLHPKGQHIAIAIACPACACWRSRARGRERQRAGSSRTPARGWCGSPCPTTTPSPAADADPAARAAEVARRAHLDRDKQLEVAGPDPDDRRRALAHWLAWADVSIESAAPGPLLPRPEPERHPRLVRVRISPLGTTGPLAGWRSGPLVDEALAGHLLLNGHPAHPPVARPGRLADYQAGLHAAIGALAALRARDATGHGQTVEASHLEGLVALHQHTITMWTHDGHRLRRQGDRQPGYWHPTGPYPARDGHVVLHVAGQAARDRLFAAIDRPELALDPRFADDVAVAHHKDALDTCLVAWTRARSAEEIVDCLQAARVAAAVVRPATAVLADSHLAARHAFVDTGDLRVPGAPFRISRIARAQASEGSGPDDAAPTATRRAASAHGLADGPLTGLRVIELGRVWAGPLAGRLLADLGADVVAVEAPDARGGRTAPPELGALTHLFPDGVVGDRPWNRIGSVNALLRNKRSITLDLRRPEAHAVFERLVGRADVLLENLGPALRERLGVDVARLAPLRRDLVVTSISGFGEHGPDAGHVAFGPVVEARTGVAHAMGRPGDAGPGRSGIAWPDPLAALHAVAGTLAALRARDAARPGEAARARHVEVPMLESALAAVADLLVEAQRTGTDPPRRGSRRPGRAPQGVYPCAGEDRWIAISVEGDEAWRGLCAVLGIDGELAALDGPARAARHDALDAAIAARTHREDCTALATRLQAAGVEAGALADARDLCASPHLAERGFWVALAHPEAGARPEPGAAIRLDATPATYRRPAPLLGEHGRAVLADWLGADEAEIAHLEAIGVLVDAPPA